MKPDKLTEFISKIKDLINKNLESNEELDYENFVDELIDLMSDYDDKVLTLKK